MYVLTYNHWLTNNWNANTVGIILNVSYYWENER